MQVAVPHVPGYSGFFQTRMKPRFRSEVFRARPEYPLGRLLSRLSERYGRRLRWHNVDFQRREVDLSKTKNYSARVIPMNASVLAAFEARKAQVPKAKGKEVVFDTPPRPWWDDVREQAGLADYRWHDNRHTFCSRLAMRKVNLVAIKELAGHKTLANTARYGHLDDDAKQEAVNSLLMPASNARQVPRLN